MTGPFDEYHVPYSDFLDDDTFRSTETQDVMHVDQVSGKSFLFITEMFF